MCLKEKDSGKTAGHSRTAAYTHVCCTHSYFLLRNGRKKGKRKHCEACVNGKAFASRRKEGKSGPPFSTHFSTASATHSNAGCCARVPHTYKLAPAFALSLSFSLFLSRSVAGTHSHLHRGLAEFLLRRRTVVKTTSRDAGKPTRAKRQRTHTLNTHRHHPRLLGPPRQPSRPLRNGREREHKQCSRAREKKTLDTYTYKHSEQNRTGLGLSVAGRCFSVPPPSAVCVCVCVCFGVFSVVAVTLASPALFRCCARNNNPLAQAGQGLAWSAGLVGRSQCSESVRRTVCTKRQGR